MRLTGLAGDMTANFRLPLMMLALVMLVTGCQSTAIRSAWFDTDFAGPPMRKIVVVGDLGNVAESRVFEGAFAAKLRAVGVDSIASHTIISDPASATDAAFNAAVVDSGAQGLLLVRVLGVDTRTQVTTTMVPGGMGWGHGGWGGPSSRMMVPAQQIRQYDLATVESKLFDVQTKQLIWAATMTTFNPRSVARETPRFADLIIGQLTRRGILSSQ